MCLPVKEGGIGFDYRLSMGLPDYFIKTIREKQDGQWNMGRLYYELISRRPGEKNIAYCESHDQALVGDQDAHVPAGRQGNVLGHEPRLRKHGRRARRRLA